MQTLDQLQAGALLGVTRLKLSCDLTEFPSEIFSLAETLEVLDLSGNQLSSLPVNFSDLKRLRILFLSDNQFTEFPAVLGTCPQLDIIGFKANQIDRMDKHALPPQVRWLILTNNRLSHLPNSIGRCTQLQKLMLAGNQLTSLPKEMMQCRKLELLRISANRITEFPTWLFSLPRLAWLAYSGNPCSKTTLTTHHLAEISWKDLWIDELLGEGASGVISKAHWRNNVNSTEVAVKVFKGEVTSDGWPSDEMNSCMTAGLHPNLVQLQGRITDHPQQKQGLVFTLIPSSFKNLGGSPDFITCTRDTFKVGTEFMICDVIRIASGIAWAAVHLHGMGIMHGDLYAHNILIDEKANPLLSDYGAATLYDRTDLVMASGIERIEVRAFGCLLEDLLNHIHAEDKNHKLVLALDNVRHACLNENTLQRPDFITIYRQMNSLQNEAAVLY